MCNARHRTNLGNPAGFDLPDEPPLPLLHLPPCEMEKPNLKGIFFARTIKSQSRALITIEAARPIMLGSSVGVYHRWLYGPKTGEIYFLQE